MPRDEEVEERRIYVYHIGLVGIQSKHAEFFGRILNIENRFPGFRIHMLWGGDAPELISAISKEFHIDRIYSTQEELIERSDAVMIITRRGSEHFRPTKLAIEAGKPLFVDKPFTSDPEEARALVSLAREKNVPLFGGSTLRFLPGVAEIKALMETNKPDTVLIRYQADMDSEYDGPWYYGSHLAELCTAICGVGYDEVKAVRDREGVVASVLYPHVKAVLNTSPGHPGLHISLLGRDVRHFHVDETNCYLYGMERFAEMLTTKNPPTDYDHYTGATSLLADIIGAYGGQGD